MLEQPQSLLPFWWHKQRLLQIATPLQNQLCRPSQLPKLIGWKVKQQLLAWLLDNNGQLWTAMDYNG